MQIKFTKKTLEDLEGSMKKEWLLSNGIGGYASSTIIGLNTRKYHGLLIAEKNEERRLLLSKLEEEVNGISLSTNQYPGTIHPEGYKRQDSFELNPLPKFTYTTKDAKIEKTICMKHGENTTIIRYKITSEKPVEIAIKPFVNFRGIHELTRGKIEFKEKMNKKGFSIGLEGKPVLYLKTDRTGYERSGLPDRWYNDMEYIREKERGYAFRENHFCPGRFVFECKKETEFQIIASDKNTKTKGDEIAKEKERIDSLAIFENGFKNRLAQAADTFIVKKGKLCTIYAGYPWFMAWGRDAMISLEGLLLVTKRYEIAKKVLEHFSRQVKDGKAPNRIGKENSYNSIDSGLWHIHAISRYLEYTEDHEFVKRKLWKNIKRIIEAIPCEKGEIKTGDENTQLTWMDAKADSKPVTSRYHSPVEVQALWHHSLLFADTLAERYGGKRYQKEISDAKKVLKNMYNGRYLDDAKGDSALRPNQLIAFSGKNIFSKKEIKNIAEACRVLVTPYGLRTLSEDNPGYHGMYEGDENERNKAYHQGSAWPWLIGAWNDTIEAAGGKKEEFRSLQEHMLDAGLGTISELFDGKEPYSPRGCISQAWSVAEVLRKI